MLSSSRCFITPGWEHLLRANRLDQVSGVYELASGKVTTRSGSSEVRQVDLTSGSEVRTVFIKKYWVNRASQLWQGMFRGTFFGKAKARRELENLEQLLRWGLDAPAPVAYGEERVAGWLIRSFLISEAVPQATTLQAFIRQHVTSNRPLAADPAPEAGSWRKELIGSLADYTRRLHQRKFVHHDYFWRNILLSGTSLRRFFLIDAHKGRRWFAGEEQRARAKDLAALDAAAPAFFRRTERLRFLLLYLGQPRLDGRAKSLLRLVLRLAAPMREKQLRRVGGQPVAGGLPTVA